MSDPVMLSAMSVPMRKTWSEKYAELMKKQHEEPRWGWGPKGSLRWIFKELDKKNYNGTVLDYGCGKGALRTRLDVKWTGYDPFVQKFSKEPVPHDFVICCDVLEHIEIEYLDIFLEQIISKVNSKGTLLLTISTSPANVILADGRNAHITLKSWLWWLQKLEQHKSLFIENVHNKKTSSIQVTTRKK